MNFKNIGALALGMCMAVSAAQAESYAGALLQLSNYNTDGLCGGNCDNRATGLKVFAGLGGGSSSGVEVAYADFGRTKSNGGSGSVSARVSSFMLAGVLRTSPLPSLSLNAKLGVAAVKATAKANGEATSQTNPSLYLGVGVDYDIIKNVKAVGSVDFVRAKVADERFGVVAFGLGAQVGF